MAQEQFKLFMEPDADDEIGPAETAARLERSVNQWFSEHPDAMPQCRLMAQSASGNVAIGIFYVEKTAKRAAKAAGAPRGRGKLSIAK